MQAMVLAAGFGSRLKPYSLVRPKPLFPIVNRPLLQAVVARLIAAGCTSITINCHHLADQIIEAVSSFDGIVIQKEQQILGTGGGLRRALDHLADEPLLVVNGDIYHLVDLRSVYEHHCRSGADVTMVLHDYPRFNCVLTSKGHVTGFSQSVQDLLLAYTGIQVVNPDVLAGIPARRFSSIIDYYRERLKKGLRIESYRIDDLHWTDMGTPEDYLALHAGLLTGIIPCWQELQATDIGNNVVIDPSSRCASSVTFSDWACVGSATIDSEVHVCRSVIWDGAHIKAGSCIVDRIVIPGCADSG